MIAAILVAAASFQAPFTVGEAAAIARLARCNVPREAIGVATDGAGAIELSVAMSLPPRGDDVATGPDIDCAVAAAIEGDFWVEFADPDAARQFEDAYDSVKRVRTRIVATQWLVARGMFQALPTFDAAAETLAAYGRRIETFCGITPGAVVHQYDVMVLAYKKRSPGSTVTDSQMECLSQAFGASNLNRDYADFFFGFVVDQAGVAADGKP